MANTLSFDAQVCNAHRRGNEENTIYICPGKRESDDSDITHVCDRGGERTLVAILAGIYADGGGGPS